jgi:hypothetical protein
MIEDFTWELSLISDATIRVFTESILNGLPKYFWEVPASSTGKYHPDYALGKGGLVRHTKAAVKIANELFNLEMFRELLPLRDSILSALILHDGLKHGKEFSEFTKFEHPVIMRDYLLENAKELPFIQTIANLIASHMGQWSQNSRSAILLPKPESKAGKFVHLCDYLASRKFIEVKM